MVDDWSSDRLGKLADAAFRKAAKKVLKRAAESGTPVVIWENGRIKLVNPHEIENTKRKK
jgi:hypothetical protein